MAEPIDLQKYRDERDCEIGWLDPMTGERWYRYALSFEFDEGEHGMELWARDEAEAVRKIAAARKTLKIDGRVFTEVPVA